MASFADNKRIAKNTIFLYVRMVVSLAISFYTSRIVLQTLGIEDIGINNVVGGIVSLLALINNSMTLSVQRFLSYEIGKRDLQAINQTFNSAVIIHFILGIIILILGETLGLYFLTHHINYPADRATAAMWVYQMSLLSSFLGIIQVPYSAMVIAYEKMSVYAYFTISDVIIRLLLVFILPIIPYDKLIAFSVFGASTCLLVFSAYRVFFHLQFREIRFSFALDKGTLKSISVFAGWSTFGEFAWAGTNQGVNILLNLFFGPAINGARAMAYQVQHIVMKFIQSYQTAMQPQIVKLYAAGELDNMQKLVYRGTCFSFYLALFFSLPIILEPNFLLWLWLGEVPEHLALFTQLVLINVLLDMLTNLYAAAAKANGKIGRYQVIVSNILALNFVLSYIVLKIGMPAYSVFIIYGMVSIILVVARLYLIRNLIPEMTITNFFKEVSFPITKVTLIAIIAPLTCKYAIQDINFRPFIVCFFSAISVSTAIWFVGLNQQEREKVRKNIYSFLHRFRHDG